MDRAESLARVCAQEAGVHYEESEFALVRAGAAYALVAIAEIGRDGET